MRALDFWKTVVRDGSDLLEELIPLLAREPVPATPEVSVLERLGRGYLQHGADASSDAVGPTRTRRPPRGIS